MKVLVGLVVLAPSVVQKDNELGQFDQQEDPERSEPQGTDAVVMSVRGCGLEDEVCEQVTGECSQPVKTRRKVDTFARTIYSQADVVVDVCYIYFRYTGVYFCRY